MPPPFPPHLGPAIRLSGRLGLSPLARPRGDTERAAKKGPGAPETGVGEHSVGQSIPTATPQNVQKA